MNPVGLGAGLVHLCASRLDPIVPRTDWRHLQSDYINKGVNGPGPLDRRRGSEGCGNRSLEA